MYTMRDSFGILIGAAVTSAYFVLLLPPAACPWGILPVGQEFALGNRQPHTVTVSTDDNLEEVLRTAAMDDKTVIMTLTNEAWTAPGSLQDLFLESLRVGEGTAPLLKHLIIVATDANAYEQCQRAHPLRYHLRVNGTVYPDEQVYLAKGYIEMMWRRNRFQIRVLELGYSFVFSDMDIIWLRNPMLRMPLAADIAMSCDHYRGGDNPYDLDKAANSGLMYVRASARMLAFYQSWYAARTSYPGTNEQNVFEQVKHELPARHGLLVQFVDTAYLSGFCELSKDFNKVCTVHANCIVGLKAKLENLAGVLDEWKQFREKQADADVLGSNTTTLTA